MALKRNYRFIIGKYSQSFIWIIFILWIVYSENGFSTKFVITLVILNVILFLTLKNMWAELKLEIERQKVVSDFGGHKTMAEFIDHRVGSDKFWRALMKKIERNDMSLEEKIFVREVVSEASKITDEELKKPFKEFNRLKVVRKMSEMKSP